MPNQVVTSPLTEAAMFVVLTVPTEQEERVHDALDNLSGLTRSVGFRYPDKQLSLTTSFGSDVWDRLFSGPKPTGLHPFIPLDGPRHHAPSTPGDVLLHVKASTLDMCFELTWRILDSLGDAVTVVDEVHGFRFFDARDLLGFVDGTENPDGDDAVNATAIGSEDPDFAGGSYVHIQKYLHDMTAWRALSVEDQEKVIGRSKLEDIEMDDDVKPANAHIALNVIEDEDGNQLQIVRQNMPFGELGSAEFGTYFIGYSRDPEVTERMLRNMFLGDPPGNTDRILDFSTAQTGCLFFTPTGEWLDAPPDLPSGAAAPSAETETATPAATSGALTIGSLKGTDR
ncbi:Dyp-type peroxidase [Tsukamurella spumae]|uniref:Dyp-type peroxidase n=1 Tax=Tsukamurella spumae TaxID=44753 RepID=A0A846WZ46_9ACTN|nr:Dyp-type peroxidase [Tsukamurella spumae]NKY17359.1 Dyp-type peroxidase [Tsukamurella spumae]